MCYIARNYWYKKHVFKKKDRPLKFSILLRAKLGHRGKLVKAVFAISNMCVHIKRVVVIFTKVHQQFCVTDCLQKENVYLNITIMKDKSEILS